MKNKKGFTLLELLIVVLIIGILAAVALPQYKKTVLKTRFATVKQNTRALYEAQQRYFMARGAYASTLNDLDIQVTSDDKFAYGVNSTSVAYGAYQLTNGIIYYWLYTGGGGLCVFDSSNTFVFNMLDKFCAQETNNGRRGCNSSTNCYYYYKKH